MSQINLHNKIIAFIKAGAEAADFEYLKKELFLNDDGIRYFYANINESWVVRLQENGFFNVLNRKAEDPTTYRYSMPELAYLTSVAEAVPKEVADVICATKTSADNFNPEVIERFFWITTKLPADQLKRIVFKMRDDQWVKLMGAFRKTGYEFTDAVEVLKSSGDTGALIDLAQALMIVRDKKGDEYRDSIFYVEELYASGIFEALVGISDEKELVVIAEYLIEQFSNIVQQLGGRYQKDEYPFDYDDPFGLYDQDLFSAKLESNKMRSFHADEKNFAASLVTILKKLPAGGVKNIWASLKKLPSSRLTWKVQLVFLVTNKEVFVSEITERFFELFDYGDKYYAIFTGPEYKQALKKAFDVVIDKDKYIEKVFSFFNEKIKDSDDGYLLKRAAAKILASINTYLSSRQKERCLSDFDFDPDRGYEPEPLVQSGMAGIVQHRSPFNISEFTVEQIFQHLGTDWLPEKLKEEYKDDDYLKPRGAEGLGDALKEDVKERFDGYVAHMLKEKTYATIHPHYVYSLIRGFEEMFRDQNTNWNEEAIQNILGILSAVKDQVSGLKNPNVIDGSWLGTWVWVKRSMADTLIYIIEFKDKAMRKDVHSKHKSQIFGLIEYLYDTPESPNVDDEGPDRGDPFHVAINSVRGRIYQGFVIYVENDGEALSEEAKRFFKNVLSDKSAAVRFMIGHYLPSLYYRDKDFIGRLFGEIFPRDFSDKLATWEGYLCSPLYQELYEKLKEYYEWGIAIDPKDYPDRKFTKSFDEALSIHIALAFVHFQSDHAEGLVGEFLDTKNAERINEFVTFIGRSYFTNDQSTKQKLEELPGGFAKFINLWDWLIQQNLEPKAYAGFGFWMSTRIIDIKMLTEKTDETFKISGGAIDWEYKFEHLLEAFADTDPEKALRIIKNYLLDKDENLNPNRRFPLFAIDDEIKKSLEIIYKEKDLKPKVEELIGLLIDKGSQMFWGLEDIMKQ